MGCTTTTMPARYMLRWLGNGYAVEKGPGVRENMRLFHGDFAFLFSFADFIIMLEATQSFHFVRYSLL